MATMDRISELPESILHHILSSLSQKQAIQTSALSKTWRHVGPTRPKIELRESWFRKSGAKETFLSVLGKTLQRYHHRNLSVHEFILQMSESSMSKSIDSEFTNYDPGKTSLFKGLKRLSLNNVHIKDQTTLEKIMRSCPLIETIRIAHCPNWYGHDKYFFPRLKTLYLNRVKLSAELFESFSSSNFPFLEDLELEYCSGFSEIQLTVSSIKRLVILIGSIEPIDVISIYAPNIHYFRLSAHYPQRLIFNTETAREWKSHVDMLFLRCSYDNNSMLSWLRQLSEQLNSLRESHISLDLFPYPFKILKVDKVPNDAVFCKPVPLEDVRVKGYHFSSSFPDYLNCLFLICRPRYIFMNWHTTHSVTDLKREKDKLSELATFKTIGNMGEMSCGSLWLRDLEEIIMQYWNDNTQGWHTVGVDGTCFPKFPQSYPGMVFSEMARLVNKLYIGLL